MNKQDKCTIGYSCGEACINTSYECKADNIDGDFATLAEAYLKTKRAGYRLAEPINEAEQDAIISQIVENDYFEALNEKANFVQQQNSKFDEDEALAVAMWVSENYPLITQHLLGELNEPELDLPMAGIAKKLYQAFDKMPGLDAKTLREQANLPNMQERFLTGTYEDLADALESGEADSYYLHRGMADLPKAYEAELKRLKPGDEHEFKVFTATSFDEATAHNFGTQYAMRLKPKADGQSSGRLVDSYKYELVESEVLFKPGTRAKIDKVGKVVDELYDSALASAKQAFADSQDDLANVQSVLQDMLKLANDKSLNKRQRQAKIDDLLSALPDAVADWLKSDAIANEYRMNSKYSHNAYTIWMTEL